MLYFKVDTEAESILEIANRPITLDEDAPEYFEIIEKDAPNAKLDVGRWYYEDGDVHEAEKPEKEPTLRSRIFGTKDNR